MRGWSRTTCRPPAADQRVAALRETLAGKIGAHPLFRLAARPKTITPLILSRYEQGMNYGSHVDDALMHGVRTDVSFTLFLSDPDSYDGGALVIESPAGEDDVKLKAGSLVAYPSTTLHRVAPVTRGARLAAVGWVRSFVRDPGASASFSSTSTPPASASSSAKARRRSSTSCRRPAPTSYACGSED